MRAALFASALLLLAAPWTAAAALPGRHRHFFASLFTPAVSTWIDRVLELFPPTHDMPGADALGYAGDWRGFVYAKPLTPRIYKQVLARFATQAARFKDIAMKRLDAATGQYIESQGVAQMPKALPTPMTATVLVMFFMDPSLEAPAIFVFKSKDAPKDLVVAPPALRMLFWSPS